MAECDKHIQITNILATNKIQFKNVPINIKLRLNNNKIRKHLKTGFAAEYKYKYKYRDNDIDDNEDRK